MAKLAAKLQGRIFYDEFLNNTDFRQPEKQLLKAIIGQVVDDLKIEIKKGYDLMNPVRVNLVEGGGNVPAPAKYGSGAYIAPLAYLLEKSDRKWGFTWVCDQMGVSHSAVRKQILNNLGLNKFYKLYGLNII